MLQRIIISILLIIHASSLTSLTTSNCPKDFNLLRANSSLDTTNSNLAVSLYSSMFAMGSNSPLQTKINSGDFSAILQ